jgi:hypothetical protein
MRTIPLTENEALTLLGSSNLLHICHDGGMTTYILECSDGRDRMLISDGMTGKAICIQRAQPGESDHDHVRAAIRLGTL